MSLTYLQLSSRLRQEAGITGTGPTAVVGQTGELKRVVDWVADAWREIQNRHNNWRWMRSSFSVNTVAGTDHYAYGDCTDTNDVATIARFKRWWVDDEEDRPKIYLSASGVSTQQRLIFMPWYDFKYIYRIGSGQSGQPTYISVDPQNNIVLGPNPDAVYVVTGDYQRGVLELTADGTTPDMPADFHLLIVWEALKKYGSFEAASESYQRGHDNAAIYWGDLRINQLPDLQTAGPMA